MLHRISLPDCEAELNAILRFQRAVLAFACDPQTKLPLVEERVNDVFNKEQAAWLWSELWIYKRNGSIEKTELHSGIEVLIKHLNKSSDRAGIQSKILKAFDQDIHFHEHLADDSFQFAYITELPEPTRNAVRPMMEAFYTQLLASGGFPVCIHGQISTFTRDKFIESFWRMNITLEVCPACDAPRSDRIDIKVYDDADHFLPKSKYPFLSIHRYNLVPLCIYCNRAFKGEFDPIGLLTDEQLVLLVKTRDPLDATSRILLTNSYHPYLDPAIDHIEIVIGRNKEGVELVDIRDKDITKSYRVASFKRVLRLHRRWQDRLRYQIESIRNDLAGDGRRQKRRGSSLNEDSFRKDLLDRLDDCQKQPGKQHWGILRSNYLRYALEDGYEFQELYAQFCGR